jgi:nucleoside-diphosphate-sugar epimerase
MKHLFCFGFGFSAQALAKRLKGQGFQITGTSRSAEGAAAIAAQGFGAHVFDGSRPLAPGALDGVTHMVISAPPSDAGDPVLNAMGPEIARRAAQFAWVAYLSTTGVYGDHQGEWVDEDAPLQPAGTRGRRRVEAEAAWGAIAGLPVQIFRLAGIYGPGRNALDNLREGSARRIVKQGQIFSRIHVEDIAGVLEASIAKPAPGRAYNVCDDEPCPPQDVITFGAQLLGIAPPPAEDFATAELSPMARSFYGESKRVSNRRVKTELGYRFLYPSYREGLRALL